MKLHTRLACVLSLIALVNGGCAGYKGLMTVPAETRERIRLASSPGKAHGTYPTDKAEVSTATARNARNGGGIGAAGVNGGAVGAAIEAGFSVLIRSTISGGANAGGKAYLTAIRNQTGDFESGLLRQQFQTRLTAAKIDLSSDSKELPVLHFHVDEFGLWEVQRGCYAPFAQATARLTGRDGKTIWTASAQSVGIKIRPRNEYSDNPQNYRDDFADVADDLARQLVQGPVRPVQH